MIPYIAFIASASGTILVILLMRRASYYGRVFWKPFQKCFLGQHKLTVLRPLSPNYKKAQCVKCRHIFLVHRDLTCALAWDWPLQALEAELDRVEAYEDALMAKNAEKRAKMIFDEACDVVQEKGFS